VEEALEVLDAKSGEDIVAEVADLAEVTRALCDVLGIRNEDVQAERMQKRQRRGGFDRGLMLIKTAASHSIERPPIPEESRGLDIILEAPSQQIVSNPADLPATPVYRRPDLRQVDQQPEKLFTFETDFSKVVELHGTHSFLIAFDTYQLQFSLDVELRRNRSLLRGTIRLRPSPFQYSLDFGGDDAAKPPDGA
jgi:hypothetical protein